MAFYVIYVDFATICYYCFNKVKLKNNDQIENIVLCYQLCRSKYIDIV